jgi:hypothetical protein
MRYARRICRSAVFCFLLSLLWPIQCLAVQGRDDEVRIDYGTVKARHLLRTSRVQISRFFFSYT